MLLINFLIHFYKDLNVRKKNQMKEIPDSAELLYYFFQRIDIRRAESYIISSVWRASEKATIKPKNEKNNECFN